MFKIILSIDGMMCGHCEAHMNDAICKKFNVKEVTSSHTDKQTVIITATDIDEQQLRDAVAEAGYELKGVQKEPYEKKGLFARFKKK